MIENGISTSDAFYLSLFSPFPLSLFLFLLLPSILVNRNRRFCGNDNTRQWNRTRSRKRTNCWDNNYSRNWPRAGRDRWGGERERELNCRSLVFPGLSSTRALGHYLADISFANIPRISSLELKSRSILFAFSFLTLNHIFIIGTQVDI